MVIVEDFIVGLLRSSVLLEGWPEAGNNQFSPVNSIFTYKPKDMRPVEHAGIALGEVSFEVYLACLLLFYISCAPSR